MNSSGAKNELSAKRFFEINEPEQHANGEFREKNILDYAGMDIWNFLFFTGYLKAVSQRMEGNAIYLTMAVPNEEIKYISENTVKEAYIMDFAIRILKQFRKFSVSSCNGQSAIMITVRLSIMDFCWAC